MHFRSIARPAGTAALYAASLAIAHAAATPPLKVEADSLSTNAAQHVSVYSGNARATVATPQGPLVIQAGRIRVHYAPASKSDGQGAQVTRLDGEDDVRITLGNMLVAQGRQARYDNASQQLDVRDGVTLWQHGRTGTSLKIDVTTGKTELTGPRQEKSR